MSAQIRAIKSSSIDGRARNLRYIQNQLKGLHDELTSNAAEIREAISKDTGNSSSEIDIEFVLTLDCVKNEYLSLNTDNSLQEEYSIANGINCPSHREAVGIAYIVPADHSLLFSVIAPLTAAIVAGNCVVVELGKTLSAVNAVLRKILSTALDSETFTVVDSRPNDPEFFDSSIQVFQTTAKAPGPALKTLQSPALAKVVAIVDRTANIEHAAKTLVRARFAFGGKSPYAPDIILVNEFRTKEFSNALLQQSTKYFAERSNGHVKGLSKQKKRPEQKHFLEKARSEEACDVLVSGDRASIVQARTRDADILKRKINEPLLVFHSISSLDDGIDFSNSSDQPLLALYNFGAPTSAKYLAQFVNASASFTNHVPVSLLVGPPSPTDYPTSVGQRYTKEMFSVPRPSYIEFDKSMQILDDIIDNKPSKAVSKARNDLVAKALAPLPPTGQGPGGQIGFFEQGLMTGAVVFNLPVIGTVVGLSSWGIWKGVKHLRTR